MIKKLLFALALGCAFSLLLIEHDNWASTRVCGKFKDFFSTSYNCSMNAAVESVSLFHPSLCCNDVVVKSHVDDGWQWKASKFTIGFSWWNFLMYGVIGLYIHIDDLAMSVPSFKAFDALQAHFALMMAPAQSAFVCTIDELYINRALFEFADSASKTTSKVSMSYAIRRIDGVLRSLLTIFDGSCDAGGISLVKKIHGSVLMDFPYSSDSSYYEVTGQCACVIPRLPENQRDCFIRGSWAHGSGICSLVNAERTLTIDPITLKLQRAGPITLTCSSQVAERSRKLPAVAPDELWRTGQKAGPITLIKKDNSFCVQGTAKGTMAQVAALAGFTHTDLFGGDIAVDGTITIANGTYDVHTTAVATDCKYAGQPIGSSCVLSCNKTADVCHGDLSIISDATQCCSGSWNYSLATQCGSLQMCNAGHFSLPMVPLWASAPGDCVLDAVCGTDGVVTGTYRLAGSHIYKKNSRASNGTFTIKNSQGRLDGVCGSASYAAAFQADPAWHLRSFVCTDRKDEKLVTIQAASDNPAHMVGALSLDFMHNLIGELYEYDVQGTGMLLVDAQYGDTMQAALQLSKGTIRIPHIYNVITGMRAKVCYDNVARTLTVTDLLCLLHKGSIAINHAVFAHDEHKALNWYAPILLKNCLVALNRTLFASLSGQLTASYNAGHLPHIKGSLFLDKSYIKENIFSSAFQKRIASISQTVLTSSDNDSTCDVTVETTAPLKVDTPFLKADVRTFFNITNTARDPHIAGELTVLSGSLLFPYRALDITKGVVTLTHANPQDPLIELVAQNQVRNHAIAMHVTGSLLQHHLMFESTPSLTEQQIIALLLVGSEQESLNIVMPTLIMTNLASLVFGSLRSESMLERCFKRFMQPFKDIHIIPRFSDQSSRGGLRGAIDIEVNDRWHALIQKNFNLTEDTRFELEYQASDDVSLRAIRDEHRDMGAEVEMRWKF